MIEAKLRELFRLRNGRLVLIEAINDDTFNLRLVETEERRMFSALLGPPAIMSFPGPVVSRETGMVGSGPDEQDLEWRVRQVNKWWGTRFINVERIAA